MARNIGFFVLIFGVIWNLAPLDVAAQLTAQECTALGGTVEAGEIGQYCGSRTACRTVGQDGKEHMLCISKKKASTTKPPIKR